MTLSPKIRTTPFVGGRGGRELELAPDLHPRLDAFELPFGASAERTPVPAPCSCILFAHATTLGAGGRRAENFIVPYVVCCFWYARAIAKSEEVWGFDSHLPLVVEFTAPQCLGTSCDRERSKILSAANLCV